MFGCSNQGTKYKTKIIRLLKMNLTTKYDNSWEAIMNKEDSKLRTYKQFKTTSSLENYLVYIKDINNRKELTKLRISSHKLQIELGRYTRPRKTPVPQRICKLCQIDQVEDEEHFIIHCPYYHNERKTLYEQLNSFTCFETLSNEKILFVCN